MRVLMHEISSWHSIDAKMKNYTTGQSGIKIFVDLWTVMPLWIRERTEHQCMSLYYKADFNFAFWLLCCLFLSLQAFAWWSDLMVEHAETFLSLYAVDMDAALEVQPPDSWDSFPLFQLLNDFLRIDCEYLYWSFLGRSLYFMPY